MMAGKNFAVIGHPIQHSLSPVMHRANFEALGLNASYVPLDINENHLCHIRDIAVEYDLSGFNVTIPHKTEIMSYLDEIDETALMMGAVNTVHIVNDTWKGYNTDGRGFINGLSAVFSGTLNKANVLIIGAGGASKAIAYAFIQEGADVYVANRNMNRFESWNFDVQQLKIDQVEAYKNKMDIIVNTTPIGMEGFLHERVLDCSSLDPEIIVADIIYTPSITPFLQEAKMNGNKILNGLPMFINQGAESFEIWTGLQADRNIMKSAVLNALSKGE